MKTETIELCNEMLENIKKLMNEVEALNLENSILKNILKGLKQEKENPKEQFTQEELKRLRRYLHPDFTNKPTSDLFNKVDGLIK